MPGRDVSDISAAITAASTAGYVTVASVTGFYVKAQVNLVDSSGANPVAAIITDINVAGNKLGIQFVQPKFGGVVYTKNDVSSYNGGTIYMPSQFVYESHLTVI